MPKAKTIAQLAPLFYPFTQLIPLGQLQFGPYTLTKRWQLLYKLAGVAEPTHLPITYLPTVTAVQFAIQHKLVAPLTPKYYIAIQSSLCLLTHASTLISIDALLQPKQSLQAVPITVNNGQATPNLFIHKTASIQYCYADTTNGPIYISASVQIQAGVCLQGPLYIGANTIIKMGASLYGNSIIGNNCLVGGEVKNSILMSYSNKAHHGYLGNSIIGNWCNLGAGTTNSNLKNTAGAITLQLPTAKLPAGNKCGMLMGSYSRTAINTSINTGTVIGVCCNLTNTQLSPTVIPNFTWATVGTPYLLPKLLTHLQAWHTLHHTTLPIQVQKAITQLYLQQHN